MLLKNDRRHAAAVGERRRHDRRDRPGRLGRADRHRRRQRVRDLHLQRDPAAGHRRPRPGAGTTVSTPRACPPTRRCRRSRAADLTPAYAATGYGGTYTGTLTAPETGTYVLAFQNPGSYTATNLSLDGKEILANPGTPPVSTYSVGVNLLAGQTYTLQLVRRRPVGQPELGHAVRPGAGHRAGGRRGQVGRHRGGRGLRRHRVRGRRPGQPQPAVGAERADLGGGRGQPAHGGGHRRGRPGGHALAEPGRLGGRRLVPGREQRHRAGGGAVRPGRPGRPPAGHLPDRPVPGARVQPRASSRAPTARCSTPRASTSATATTTRTTRRRCSRSATGCPTPTSLSATCGSPRSTCRTPASNPGATSCGCNGQSGTQVTVSATVTNTGKVAGSDVAQLYLGDPAAAGEPPRQLKGFQKVTLQPGQSTTVRFTLSGHDLSYWDDAANGWVVPDGSSASTWVTPRRWPTCRCAAASPSTAPSAPGTRPSQAPADGRRPAPPPRSPRRWSTTATTRCRGPRFTLKVPAGWTRRARPAPGTVAPGPDRHRAASR